MSKTSYSVDDFFSAAEKQRSQLNDAVFKIQSRRDDHQRKLAQLKQQFTEVSVQLKYVLLPELTAIACNHAAELTGFAQLRLQQDPIGVLNKERAKLAADLAFLATEPQYRDRELLRTPRVGKLTGEIDELEDFRKTVAQVLTYAVHVRLDRLLRLGYGTDKYEIKWWRLSYYEDWKAGDEILEMFPDKNNFAEVREEILQARQTISTYDERLTELRAEVAEGEQLEQLYKDTASRLEHLEAVHLADWRERLIKHVIAMDWQALGEHLREEGELILLLKTAHGLQKKIGYLEEIAKNKLHLPLKQLVETQKKLERDIIKYSRPKKRSFRFAADKFERRFRDRSMSWRKSWQRYDDTHSTIYSFQHYNRASFAESFLWWDLMTDGRLDGNFIDEVRDFKQTHPDYHWQRDALDDDLAAAASIAADQADRTDAISFDAS